MSEILIIYASDYGNTKKMAETVAEGVRTVKESQVILKTTEEVTADDMLKSDGIIFASPVHMGSLDWRVKKVIDTVCSELWMKDQLVGKVGAVCATGSGFGNGGGGAEMTMLSMLTNIAELGMIIVPLPKSTPGYSRGGLQWGPWARSADENLNPSALAEKSLLAAKHHGANVARIADLVKGKELFAK